MRGPRWWPIAQKDPGGSTSSRPKVNALDAPTRAALAAAWLDDAYAEHASIAAFTRVSMQLIAVAAPPELLEGAHRAALDEVRHARLCFTLASMYGARWEAPGPIAPDAIRHATCRRVSLAREALLEGCLGEGVAAAIARASRDTAEDPAVMGALATIADDEARHCRVVDPGVVPRDRAARWRRLSTTRCGRWRRPTSRWSSPEGIDAATWASHGRVDPARAEALHEAVARRGRARVEAPRDGGPLSAISPRRGAARSRRA